MCDIINVLRVPPVPAKMEVVAPAVAGDGRLSTLRVTLANKRGGDGDAVLRQVLEFRLFPEDMCMRMFQRKTGDCSAIRLYQMCSDELYWNVVYWLGGVERFHAMQRQQELAHGEHSLRTQRRARLQTAHRYFYGAGALRQPNGRTV